MQSESDAQLLREYAEHGADSAFTAIVTRHTNLVYSAALRQVESPDLAAEVAQRVFIGLARGARALSPRLAEGASLAGWLCRSARNLSLNLRRDEFRQRTRERQAMEDLNSLSETALDWERLRPVLDAAMAELGEADYDALVMRFYNHQDLRSIGQALGVSDDTAQKRISRALDKLQEHLSRRGISGSAAALSIVIAANAVQAAPAGLAATLSTATLAGTVTAAATVTAAKIIALTTLQKALIAATLAVVAGTGIFEAHQASRLRGENQAFQKQQAASADRIQQLERERDEASLRLAGLREENARLRPASNQAELLKLRGEVGSLRGQLLAAEARGNPSAGGFSKLMRDPAMREMIRRTWVENLQLDYADVFRELKLTSEQKQTVVQLFSDRFMKSSDQVADLMEANAGAAEIARLISAEKAEMKSQLQTVLGEAGGAKLEDFRQTIPARVTVEMVKSQLGPDGLSDDQSDQLLKVVKAEPFDLIRGMSGELAESFYSSSEEVDQYLQKVAASNQRIVQQAGSFLSTNQLAALDTVLANGISLRTTQAAAMVPKH